MSAVQLLKSKASANSNYAYLKLLQKYKFTSREVHYVFEGYDDLSFYFNFLRDISNDYVTHITLGKKQSIELYEKLDWTKYEKKRIIIFIDQDYSKLLGERDVVDENIYETTYYSIENYIPSPSILRRLINEILHYHDEDEVLKIVSKYEQEYKVFAKVIQPLIGWILLVRSNKLKANLNMIDLSQLFKIDSNLNVSALDVNKIDYLEKVTGVKTPTVGLSTFRDWRYQINQLPNCKLFLRGKYEMWFLLSFFKQLNVYLKDNYGYVSKVITDINHRNAIEIIGPRVSIPERLSDFLKRIYP